MGRLNNLTGMRFGRLVVLHRARNNGKSTMWLCKCDCGNEKAIHASSLIKGATKSCGCYQKKHREDLTGRRYGRLVALYRDMDSGSKNKWVCQCDCGNKHVVSYYDLTRKDSRGSRSCGCLKRDLTIERTRTHGLSKHRLYTIYNNIIKRCEDKTHRCYDNYGGRGIKMCDEWRDDFVTFYNWACDNGYRAGLTIDRVDNDRGYCPENCRWVTRIEQQNNRRDNNNLTLGKEKHTVTEWSRITGIKNSTIRGRIASGWAVEDALTIKPSHNNRYKKLKAL